MPHTTRCRSGVRGSTPCPCDANRFYGGNTSCVALEAPGHEPIVFDLGTGLRFWGATMDPAKPFRGSALLTHMHWEIGRAHVCTPVTNAHIVCRLLIEKKIPIITIQIQT